MKPAKPTRFAFLRALSPLWVALLFLAVTWGFFALLCREVRFERKPLPAAAAARK